MQIDQAFSLLEIPIKKDAAAVRQAYQRLLPRHHPEEDPQGFMELHEAYKTALAYARGTAAAEVSSRLSFGRQSQSAAAAAETGYDSLFSDLEQENTKDLSQPKQEFLRKIRAMKFFWLPIPLNRWQELFSSEAFQLCRGLPACMNTLLELIEEKKLTYPAFVYLVDQLWELSSWQTGNGVGDLSDNTRNCIRQLKKRYSNYLDYGIYPRFLQKFMLGLWYYLDLPFLFKQLVTALLFPVLAMGNGHALLVLLYIYYSVECFHLKWKTSRRTGGSIDFSKSGFVIISISVQVYICAFLTELIGQWLSDL